MSDWELIDDCRRTGLRKYIGDHPDDPDGVLIRYEQSAAAIDAILERNKAVQGDSWDRKDEMWHAAHIPIGVMFEWKQKYGVDAWDENHWPAVQRLLNSNEWRYLRVRHFII